MRAYLALILLILAGCSAGDDGAHLPLASGTPASAAEEPRLEQDSQAPAVVSAAELRKKIVELSTRERVLSDYTALLVLESEADYQRFHLDRRSLAEILYIDPNTWMIELGNVRGREPYDPADLSASTLPLQPTERSEAPLSLTSSEGVGLRLKRLRASAVIQGPLAFTELHLSFQNPQKRVLEGRFELTLPEGAAISRLAMRNERQWVEGEVSGTPDGARGL